MPATQLSLVDSEQTDQKSNTLGYKKIDQRKSLELVFAFVEPIGGGSKHAADNLTRFLEAPSFGYKVNNISMSSIIKEEAERLSFSNISIEQSLREIKTPSLEARTIYELQQWGNTLREKFGSEHLAKLAISKVVEFKMENEGYEEVSGAVPVQKPRKFAHIIRSIKHKDELKLLKSIYGNIFFLIGTSGSYEQQLKSFRKCQGVKKQEQRKIEYEFLSKIDQKEGIKHGQQVREIFYQSDLFLNSQNDTLDEQLTRFLSLLFGREILSPTTEETMMSSAFTARLRSTCLSRQVGAAICDQNNELISVGWNDVPAYGGGLTSDFSPDADKVLCKGIGSCRSKKEISKLLSKIYNNLKNNKLLIKDCDEEDVLQLLEDSGLKNLIEFSRAIHAEMEAILSAARTAKKGLKEGKIYVTTYPCDNCAKHILAVGLSEVVYIEPYPKSRAKDFFYELIEDAEKENSDTKLTFKQFVGIAPRAYALFFEQWYDRKNKADGTCVDREAAVTPLTDVYLDSYPLYENHITEELGKLINDAKTSIPSD